MGFSKMDRLLEKYTKTTVPGCACVIMKDTEPIYEGYFGYADIEEKANS